MVFGRVRLILTGGLCPKATYQVTAPYGQLQLHHRQQRRAGRATRAPPTSAAPRVAPNVCDFTLALDQPQAKSFLRWDPAVAPAGSERLPGDATTLHPIVGGTNGNAFPVTGPGANGNTSIKLTTNLFTVMPASSPARCRPRRAR